MHCRKTIITNFEVASLADVGHQVFDRETDLAQAAAMGHEWGRQKVQDVASTQSLPVSRRAISTVAVGGIGFMPRMSGPLAGQRGNIRQESEEFSGIMPLGTGDPYGQRRAVTIGKDMPFCPFFGPIRGVFAGERPPKTARMDWLSTRTLDQSILPFLATLRRARWNNFFHTPRLCQWRIRRQQVTPEPQFISSGSISQGMPLRSTKMIPARHARSSTAGRPGLPSRHLWPGSKGSISRHNSSDTKSRSMTLTPAPLRCDDWIILGGNFEIVL